MDSVYTGIDLGTDSIKIIVCTKHNNHFNVLASTSIKSLGIKDGQIEDTSKAVEALKMGIKRIDEMLGININKAIICVPDTDSIMDITTGNYDLSNESITGDDIVAVLRDSLVGKIKDEYELVTAIPISFTVDKKTNILDPKGMIGEHLQVKCVITSLPKEPLYRIFEVLKLSGIEVVDVSFNSTGDYYTVKNDNLDKEVGAIINIGEFRTNIAIFNKGIQIKNSFIPVGSYNVDKDISYIFKTDIDTSRNLKEHFAVASLDNADDNEIMNITLSDGTTKEVSQSAITKVVEARGEEILKLAKNEIKNLTKREISYIIVTGGLSELVGFQTLVDNELGSSANVIDIHVMGIRHNKYSSCYGTIKYFASKIALRGKEYNMLNREDLNALGAAQQDTPNSNIISKVFGHFFDN
jgi:cell division protein FtsA